MDRFVEVGKAREHLKRAGAGRIDVDKADKGIIMLYSDNPAIEDARDGVRSVEGSLLKLRKYNKGMLRRLISRRRNSAYNAERQNLKQLVSPVPAKSGLLTCDNFVAGAVYAGLVAYGFMKLPNYIAGLGGVETTEAVLTLQNYVTLGAAFIGGIASMFRRKISYSAREDARRIDERIGELGLKKSE